MDRFTLPPSSNVSGLAQNNPSTEAAASPLRNWLIADLGTVPYRVALDLQHRLVTAVQKKSSSGILLMLEHPPVFTLGRRGGLDNLRIPAERIESLGIEIVQVERGGDITFHGPGQLVVYPILHMAKGRIGVTDLVGGLESAMIRTARTVGVEAQTNPMNRGVWVGKNKLGSIGIAVRKGVSFHGMALNVNIDLSPFDWINPCGLKRIGMTSLKCERREPVSMEAVRTTITRHIRDVFAADIATVEPSEIGFAAGGLLRFRSEVGGG